MPTTISYSTRLVRQDCYSCGVPFAMSESLYNEAIKDHSRWFYCPNGHSQHFIGKTDEQLERERRIRAEATEQALRDQLAASERSKAALKGVVTKTKRRIGKGVCPCCNRHFTNVERHMESRHPEYAESPSA